MGTAFRDLRHSLRSLYKAPGVALLAVLILALGSGGNVAIFSIVDVLLFRPLPVSNPDQLVRIFTGKTKGDARAGFVSLPDYEEYRDNAPAFSGIAACLDRFPANVSAAKFGSERVNVGMVTGNYFPLLGVHASLGRTLVPDDERTDASPVALLSHSFWKRHYASDAKVLESQILVDGQWFTIAGVVPADFGGVSFENFPELWIPLAQGRNLDPLLKTQLPLNHRSFAPFVVIGRLRTGISLAQAQVQLDTMAARLGAGKPIAEEGNFQRAWPVLVSATQAARKSNQQTSWLLLGIVILVLLIACADVAGLMLARSETRQREFAVRIALGAPRSRLLVLHFYEALLISAAGAVIGLLIAAASTRIIALSAPAAIDLPLQRSSSILDVRVLAFTIAVSLLTALISAMVPALRYSRSDLALEVKTDSRRSSAIGRSWSIHTALVLAQIASAVVLLAAAGLLARTLWQASKIQLGFSPANTVFGSTDLIRQGYTKEQAASLLAPLLQALRAQPGVQSAALGAPPLQFTMQTMVKIEGAQSGDAEKQSIALVRVSDGYFDTTGIPLPSGRDFRPSDGATAPGAAIVSQSFAHKWWPDKSAIGMHLSHAGIHDQTFEIVGVVGDTAGADPRQDDPAVVYLPLEQSYLMFPWQPDVTLIAHGARREADLISSLRRAVVEIDPALPLFRVRTLDQQVSAILGEEKFLARLLIVFTCVAVVLAAAGLFGLMAYTTARATHEFGLRMALGAQKSHVLWMVLRRALILSGVGLAIGLGGAHWLSRYLNGLLFNVSRNDLATFVVVPVATILVALLASFVPALRATSVDPLVALREE
ncbi:MAG TPA: ABC transporter permease [Candidatus Limnocylindrales bacterium]|nr:ABC transporter permease [Candidatus Limnocylindrales bacterium]